MRIRAHQRIRIRLKSAARWHRANHACQIFQMYLVTNSRFWRHYLEVLEGRLTPPQECVSFRVALKFELRVQSKCIHISKTIHLHRMVDYQLGREEGSDSLWVAAHILDGFPHRRQIHYRGYSRKILEQYARRHKRNLFFHASRLP